MRINLIKKSTTLTSNGFKHYVRNKTTKKFRKYFPVLLDWKLWCYVRVLYPQSSPQLVDVIYILQRVILTSILLHRPDIVLQLVLLLFSCLNICGVIVMFRSISIFRAAYLTLNPMSASHSYNHQYPSAHEYHP